MRRDPPEGPDRPIEELAAFEFEADPAFRETVQRKIDRRLTTGEIVRMSTLALVHVAIEFLTLVRHEHPESPESPVPEE